MQMIEAPPPVQVARLEDGETAIEAVDGDGRQHLIHVRFTDVPALDHLRVEAKR